MIRVGLLVAFYMKTTMAPLRFTFTSHANVPHLVLTSKPSNTSVFLTNLPKKIFLHYYNVWFHKRRSFRRWALQVDRNPCPFTKSHCNYPNNHICSSLTKVQRPYDQYVEGASIMVLGHNVIIRGLNSIYRQAPHLKPEDHADFIAYAKCWSEILGAHHKMEETSLFPQIEARTGETGLMQDNVEQHRKSTSLQIVSGMNKPTKGNAKMHSSPA